MTINKNKLNINPINELELITKISVDLSKINTNDELYIYMCKTLKELTNSKSITISEYNPEKKSITIKYIDFESAIINTFLKAFGKNIIGIEAPVTDEHFNEIIQNVVNKQQYLSDLTFGAVPHTVSKIINTTFGVDYFLGLAFIFENQLFGTALVAISKNEQIPSNEFFKSFCGLVWVTKKKLFLEKKLIESEKKFKTLFDNAGDSFFLHDLEGNIIDTNIAACQNLGYTLEEILNLSVFDIESNLNKESLRILWDKLQIEKEATIYGIHKRKDNSHYKCEIHLTPLFVDNRYLIFASARDITERLQSEKNRIENERRLSLAISATNDAIWEWNIETNKTYYSPRWFEMLGYQNFEFEPNFESWKNLVHPEDLENSLTRLNATINDNNNLGYESEFRMRAKDGSWLWILGRGNIVEFNDSGKPLILTGTNTNITEKKKAELALIVSESKYHDLFEKSKDAILILENGVFIDCNQSAVEMLGYKDKKEFLNVHPSVLSPKYQSDGIESIEKAEFLMKEAISLGSTKFEWEHIKSNGEIFPVEIVLTCIKNHENEVLLHTVWRDITSRRASEIALKESFERNRLISEMLTDYVFIVEMDENKVPLLQWISDSYYKNTGLTKEQVLGSDQWINLIYRDDKPKFIEFMNSVFIYKMQNSIEVRSISRGNYITWINVYVKPTLDNNNEIVSIVGGVKDITQRKLAEEAIIESEKRYRIITENLVDVIWNMDLNLRLLYISPSCEKLQGWTAEEFINLKPNEFIKENSLMYVMNVLNHTYSQFKQGLISKDYSLTFEVELYKKDKSTFWSEITAKTMINEKNEFTGIIGVTRDITERKIAEDQKRILEEQLLQTQKMESIGRLSGGVAHDLNNMLTPILGYAEIINMTLNEEDKNKQRVKNIIDGVLNSRDLVKQLLAFARKQTLEINPTNINDIIKNFDKMIRRTIRENIDIKYILDDNIPNINADIVQIQQILMNLFVNSQDAMPDGGSIIIETKTVELNDSHLLNHTAIIPGRYVEIIVSDTGIGMDAEVKAKVFEPFFTTKGLGKGTGLGLSTVFGIVNQHGGHIWLYSEINIGTTFKIYFPSIPDENEENITEMEENIAQKGFETLLIVEDQIEVLNMLIDYLEYQGYKVISALDGNKAISLFEERWKEIDLLVTDIILPDLNGKEVYDRMNMKNPNLKVLYMSGYSEDVITIKHILKPNVNFIQKPFNLTEFTNKIREIIDNNN
jgi:two-component system cell cycle sensor histidine kinase/response regulator CckA